MKNKIEIYVKVGCPYCVQAIDFFMDRGIDPVLYNISNEPKQRDELLKRVPDAKTVPQIFIDGVLIGGYSNLVELESQGKIELSE